MTTTASPAFTDTARLLLCKRYLRHGPEFPECPSCMAGSVSEHKCDGRHETVDQFLDRISLGNPEYRAMFQRLDFLPNSPTLFNIGLGDQTMLSACFKFNVPDDMAGIFDVQKRAGLVIKEGGGTGFEFSGVRARGSRVRSTQGYALGPLGVMELYHTSAKVMTQGGKRNAAQMAILRVDHPDIREFIHSKDDGVSLSTFNISVGLTDEFMAQVLAKPDGDEAALFREIVDSAWKTGDPGVFFIDAAERGNPTPWLGQVDGTNPCLSGDTPVWTINGPVAIGDLVGREVPVLTEDAEGNMVYRMMRNIHRTGHKAVYRVRTRALRGRYGWIDGEFKATSDHVVFLKNGSQCTVSDLAPGSRLSSVYRHRANSKGYLKLVNTAGDEDMEHRIVASYAHGFRPEYPAYHVDHIDEEKANNHPDNLRVMASAAHNALKMLGDRNPVRRFPERNVFATPGFASGERNGMYGKRHKPETIEKLRQVNHEVVSVEYIGEQDVYDGTVDDTHRFFVQTEEDGGVLVHNCGEVPLLPNEACNLGSINLGNFVTDDREIDWERLRYTTNLATRYLDDVLDHNWFPDPLITEAVGLTRKLGLGVCGEADMLALMRVRYASDEAVTISEELARSINQWALETSILLGEEKGVAPAYMHHGADAWLIAEKQPRNTTRTCIAPTGSIYQLMGAKSSGIEPHFAIENERRMGDGTTYVERVDFGDWVPDTAMGDAGSEQVPWEYHVRHQAAWQRHTDLAVSKTINMRGDVAAEDIYRAYVMMWQSGCKGGTVYRDGAHHDQILTVVEEAVKPTMPLGASGRSDVSELTTHGLRSRGTDDYGFRRPLPDERRSVTKKMVIGSDVLYVTVGLYEDGSPGELFITTNKQGTTVAGLCDTVGRLASHALQQGVSVEDVADAMSGMVFEPSGLTRDADEKLKNVSSPVDYIGRWLVRRFGDGQETAPAFAGIFCPECHGRVMAQSGCMNCEGCGWSKC